MAPITTVAGFVSAEEFDRVRSTTNATLAHKEPVHPSIQVCLDFLKGRCTRTQCKFHHPDLSEYQQLSDIVKAQAGRQICEVWAMTGQCKFGVKCNKLHPSPAPAPPQPAPPAPPVQPVAALPFTLLLVPQLLPALMPLQPRLVPLAPLPLQLLPAPVPSMGFPERASHSPPQYTGAAATTTGRNMGAARRPQHVLPPQMPRLRDLLADSVPPPRSSPVPRGELEGEPARCASRSASPSSPPEEEPPQAAPSGAGIDQAVLDLLRNFQQLCPPSAF